MPSTITLTRRWDASAIARSTAGPLKAWVTFGMATGSESRRPTYAGWNCRKSSPLISATLPRNRPRSRGRMLLLPAPGWAPTKTAVGRSTARVLRKTIGLTCAR